MRSAVCDNWDLFSGDADNEQPASQLPIAFKDQLGKFGE